uniref:Plac8 onzin related protein 6 n=1 Tax=Maylandia zebra TaxID=106582 RepID=A0A3P9CBB3_9CICH
MTEPSSAEWGSGLFDCMEDKLSCCYAFWCWPCYAITISKSLGENPFLPILDMCSPGALSILGIPLFVVPVALSFRITMRKKYGIEGTLQRDIVHTCFCNLCVWCQIDRELKRRKNSSTVLSQNPVTAQPGATGNYPGSKYRKFHLKKFYFKN